MLDHDNLEEFADAVEYDMADSGDEGVAFYGALAEETGGPVLELACGTGRVAIPIAKSGFHVTGLDIVPGMLAQARRKSQGMSVRWVEGDARAFETRNPLLPNTNTREGFFPTLETIGEEVRRPSYTDAEGREVRVTTTQVYDHVSQVLHVTSTKRRRARGREQTQVARTALRYTFPQELAALLGRNGFDTLRRYGDWDEGPLTAESPSIISVCRKCS